MVCKGKDLNKRPLERRQIRDRDKDEEQQVRMYANSFDSVITAVNFINKNFSSVFVPEEPLDKEVKGKSERWTVNISNALVEKIFSSLDTSKAMGDDGIPTILYKHCAQYLAGPFTHLFNLSIESSRFPSRWKHSHVCPVPKSSPPDIGNLRPISLLPVPAKVLE